MANKKSFVMYENWSRLIYDMPDEQAVKLIKKICGYVLEEETPSDPMIDAIFNMIKITLDADSQKYEEICKKRSDARKRIVNKCQQVSTSVNKCQQVPTDNDNDNDNDNEINIKEKNKKEKPVKHKYGEYGNVLLTDEELDKLKAKFPSNYIAWIDRLSGYVESTGKKYKSHYATILNWSKRDDNTRASPSFGKFEQNEYDFDSLEEQLLANGGKHGQSI